MNEKNLVLTVLLAVSISAVRAEEQTTFVKVKKMAEKVVTHPATKIGFGAALIASTAFVLIMGRKKAGEMYEGMGKCFKPEVHINGSVVENPPLLSERVAFLSFATAVHVPVLTTIGLGLYLMGTGAKELVEKIKGDTIKPIQKA